LSCGIASSLKSFPRATHAPYEHHADASSCINRRATLANAAPGDANKSPGNGALSLYLSGSNFEISHGHAEVKALPVKALMASVPVGIVILKNRTLSPVAQLSSNALAKSPTRGEAQMKRHGRFWPDSGISSTRRTRQLSGYKQPSLGTAHDGRR
jgi:hypothetical protein